MKVGFIGSGNRARAIARGWGDPVLASDSGSGRAADLAAELGGRAASNAEVAREADLVVLCHKPYQLAEVAVEIAGEVTAIASVLGGTSAEALREAYPGVPVFRLIPKNPVEVRRGITCYAQMEEQIDADLERQVLELFGRLGTVITVEDRLLGVAGGVFSVGPAYQALLAEAKIDAAIRLGLKPGVASQLGVE